MTVEQPDVVDFMSEDPDSGRVVLTISDHLPWTDGGHRKTLERKVEAYLRFIGGSDLIDRYPDLAERGTAIEIVLEHAPPQEAVDFLENLKELVKGTGVDFFYLELPSRYRE